MKQIAVFFPGIGYHCDMPLLYFSRKAVMEAGFRELVNLDYSCPVSGIFEDPEKMQAAGLSLYVQAEKLLEKVQWSEYDEILFVSKSVGTVIAAAYAKRHGIVCRNVFYTPVEATFGEEPKNGIAFTGTSDPWAAEDAVRSGCQKAGIPLIAIEGANHSLETGDLPRDLDILKEVMLETARYVRHAGS